MCDMLPSMRTANPVQPSELDAKAKRRLLYCALPALVIPLFGSIVYFVLLGPTPFASATYVVTKLFTVVWPILAVFVIERRPRDAFNVHKGARVRALPGGLVTGLIIGGAILLAYRIPALHAYALGFTETIRTKLEVFGVTSRTGYLLLCAFLAMLHSLIEEFYWRWYVFGSLSRVWPTGISVIVASLGFAAHHYVVLGCYFNFIGAVVFGTGVGIGGALWCVMLKKQGTIAGTWLSHALVDAAIFIVGYDMLFGGIAG